MQRRAVLVIGIALSLLAVFLVKVYLDQQRRVLRQEAERKLAEERANLSSVLVARTDIPRGVILEPDMIDTTIVPNQYIQPQAVTSLDRIAGMITVAPISKDEQITLSKLSSSRQAGSLAMATPVGKRAITISVDNISSVGGMISPGDNVDVIGILAIPTQVEGQVTAQLVTIPLFQNVLVLAVGQELGTAKETISRYTKEEKTEASAVITLALTPQEANIIAFVQEQGKIRLILRSPADSQAQAVTPTNWDNLFMYLFPPEEIVKKTEPAPTQPKEELPKKVVEIIRGLEREVVPLSH